MAQQPPAFRAPPADPGAFWDERFAGDTYRYGTEPNRFLSEHAHDFGEGLRVLMPGDGEGRNGVYLAKLGHKVTIVDVSKRGIEKSEALAERRGVEIVTVHANLQDWEPPTARFDLIGCFYLHLHPDIWGPVQDKLIRALKPGGVVIFEAFGLDQLKYGSGGPGNPDMLMSPEKLRKAYAGFTFELLEEKVIELGEGEGHKGEGAVVRMIARKPAG
jgi:SAM-dependent methyltransferase